MENPSDKGAFVPQGETLLAQPVPGLKIPRAKDFDGEIDFTHPDFALSTRMYSIDKDESQFFYSYDRGKTWNGPYRFPMLGMKSITARTNIIINGKRDCMAFLTGELQDSPECSFMARTTDGAKTWRFVSMLDKGSLGIMPSAARVSQTEIFAAIRREDGDHGWISGHFSCDNGETWKQVSDPAGDLGDGNPPMVLCLLDGRICITYGDRGKYQICARLSNDGGKSWGPEILLRDNGGSHDLGYTRTVQRPDGKAVTVYYFWERQGGPERYIAATIWDPTKISR